MGILFDRGDTENIQLKFKKEEENLNSICFSFVLGRDVYFDDGRIVFIESKEPNLEKYNRVYDYTKNLYERTVKNWILNKLGKENNHYGLSFIRQEANLSEYKRFREIVQINYKVDCTDNEKVFIKERMKGYISSFLSTMNLLSNENKEGLLIDFLEVNFEDIQKEFEALVNERKLLDVLVDMNQDKISRNKVKI